MRICLEEARISSSCHQNYKKQLSEYAMARLARWGVPIYDLVPVRLNFIYGGILERCFVPISMSV
jgi:hypothetical protein